jgi:hypothetical protein
METGWRLLYKHALAIFGSEKFNCTVYYTELLFKCKFLILKEKLPADCVENPRVDGSIPSQATKILLVNQALSSKS